MPQVPTVPHESPNRTRAIFTPGIAHPISRFPMNSLPGQLQSPGFDAVSRFRRLNNGSRVFAFSIHTRRIGCAFSLTLTTMRLNIAAQGGLNAAPAGRVRRVFLHLSCSFSHGQNSYFISLLLPCCCSTLKSIAQLWFGAVSTGGCSRTTAARRRRGVFVRIARPSAR